MVIKFLVLSSILVTWVVVASGRCVKELDNEVEEANENVQAPSTAPPSSSKDCSGIIYDMADCVPYLSQGSKKTKPDHSCCSGFETVIETNADCVCEALKESDQLGLQLNLTRTLALPSACGLSHAPLKDCHLSNVPPHSSPGVSPTTPVTPVNPPKPPSPKTAPPPKSPPPPPPSSPESTPSSGKDTSAPPPAPPSSGKGSGGPSSSKGSGGKDAQAPEPSSSAAVQIVNAPTLVLVLLFSINLVSVYAH